MTAPRYILENPARAGLAKTVLDYPFVGSQVYELKDLVATMPERDWRRANPGFSSTKVEPYRWQ